MAEPHLSQIILSQIILSQIIPNVPYHSNLFFFHPGDLCLGLIALNYVTFSSHTFYRDLFDRLWGSLFVARDA